MDWQKCMNHAIDYIENNLSDEIDYSIAAKCVNCSSWEFQRVFSFMAQIPLSEYIRRRRLSLAAHDIQVGRDKVIDVAMRYGYDSPAAFSRAFSQLHGVTPKSARDNGVPLKVFPRLTFKFILEGVSEMNYRIEKKEAFDLIGFKRRMTEVNNAHFHDIGQFWSDFLSQNMWDTLIKYSKNPNEEFSYAVSTYDNNDNTKNYFWYTIGVPYNGDKFCENLEILHIASGSYAVFEMPHGEEVGDFTLRIFREWLPASGYQLTGGAELELSNSKGDTIIWLPIRE